MYIKTISMKRQGICNAQPVNFSNPKMLILVATDMAVQCKALLKKVMKHIKLISMKSKLDARCSMSKFSNPKLLSLVSTVMAMTCEAVLK